MNDDGPVGIISPYISTAGKLEIRPYLERLRNVINLVFSPYSTYLGKRLYVILGL